MDVAHGDTQLELPPRRIAAVVAALMLGNLLAVIDTTIVAVALPTISAEFDNLTDQAWIVVAYMLASTALVPVYGKLSDQFGRKNVYQMAIGVFTVGSLACGVAQSMAQLIGARVLQGIGAGGLMVSALAIIGEVVSPRQRGRVQAYLTVVSSAGIVAGPAVGGVLVDALSWRWVFLINLPIGLAALAVIAVVLTPTPRGPRQAVDLPGAALVVGAVACLLLALAWGGERHAWGSATILGLLAAAAVGLGLFLAQERRAAAPVMPLHLLRTRAVAVSAAYAFVLSLAVFGGTVIPIQQFIQVVVGADPSDVWQFLTPFAVLNVVSAMFAGRFIARTGRYKGLALVSSCGVLVTMALMATMSVDTGGAIVASQLGLLGLAMGFGAVVPVLAAQNEVARHDLGATSGIVSFFQQLGGSVGTAIFATLFTTRLEPRLDDLVADGVVGRPDVIGPDAILALDEPARRAVQTAYAESLNGVYVWVAVAAAVGIGVAFLLRESELKSWSYAARDAVAASD